MSVDIAHRYSSPLMDLNPTLSSPPWLCRRPSHPPLPLFLRPTSFSTSSPAALFFVSRHNLDMGRRSCGPAPLPPRSLPKDASVEAELRPAGGERSGMRRVRKMASMVEEIIPPDSFVIVSACVVGLLTGLAVVVFNVTVHEIRYIFWDGIPSRGASWLREEPLTEIWQRVISVPVCGGVLVSALNALRGSLDTGSEENGFRSGFKATMKQFLKSVAAAVTLGTGNSLGPEGPSVEIGSSIAKGVGHLFERSSKRRLSLIAAGSAAGISSGFNAAVAGCFFAVESVLWPSSADASSSLPNTTSMVILSAVIASVISEVGLGSAPAFTVPQYDFRSPSELPLYLLLGVICGLVSLTLSSCTSAALKAVEDVHKATGVDKSFYPIIGGLGVGLIALAYPEVLYWGFENVDILLESRPFVKGLPANLLFQLVAVKIVATSLCRASGLVGGYYAPSLFIGAATGMAYGKFAGYIISQFDPNLHLSFLEVASPQAYGLVGMAATLAGVCQVPLTSVLLLFELTQDYRIVLPLLGAVGLSSWITSMQSRKREVKDKISNFDGQPNNSAEDTKLSSVTVEAYSSSIPVEKVPNAVNLCEVESSLCIDNTGVETKKLEERIKVSEAMRTSYVTVLASTSLEEAIAMMFASKQSFALVLDSEKLLIGAVTLEDIQYFSKVAAGRNQAQMHELFVSQILSFDGLNCNDVWMVTPNMNLLQADNIMKRHDVSLLAVISESTNDKKGHPVGVLDRDCMSLTCKAVEAKELLELSRSAKTEFVK